MAIFLKSIALQYFRGIGPEVQRMKGFTDLNFFIGANNAGKSIILNFISNYLPLSKEPSFRKIDTNSAETYRGEYTGVTRAAIGLTTEEFLFPVSNRLEEINAQPNLFGFCEKIAEYCSSEGIVWLCHDENNPNASTLLDEPDMEELADILHRSDWNRLWSTLSSSSGGSLEQHWLPDTLGILFSNHSINSLPSTRLIPAKRELGAAGESFDDLSGRGLIDRLAEIQSPDHHEREKRKDFDDINRFLQEVTDKEDVTIEVPHDRKHLLVHMDNKVLPLASLGTGIHEVVLIAAFCTLHKEEIICIEEPEIHLHPILQRKLVRYLKEKTDNQYFIATHSAAFIDTPGSSVYRVENRGDQSRIYPAAIRGDKRSICNDLGYKASDLMQSNAVIWVEGPSDRIYIRHWISAVDPELYEGTHYSIMFYGGRLLSHLSAEENEVTSFIDLRSLNQNIAIIIDSDKENAHSKLNATKKRLIKELESERGLSWVTKGREIENYIVHKQLQEAIKAVHPTIYGSASSGEQYDHALFFTPMSKRKKAEEADSEFLLYKKADKVKTARLVCEESANLDILDLRKQINSLVDFIRKAN